MNLRRLQADTSGKFSVSDLFFWLLLCIWLISFAVILALALGGSSSEDDKLVADASVEIVQGQLATWDQLGTYAVTDLRLQEMNPDVGAYLANSEIEYKVIEMEDNSILFEVQATVDEDPEPTVRILIDSGEISSVACVATADSCKDSELLSPHL